MAQENYYHAGDVIYSEDKKAMFRLCEQDKEKGFYHTAHAYDVVNGRDCFLKFFRTSSDEKDLKTRTANLSREGQFRFYYPYIEHVYGNFFGMDPDGDRIFGVSLEYVPGRNLRDYRVDLKKDLAEGKISEETAERLIFRQILQFLYGMNYYIRYAKPGYFHRDIKPANIMITKSGDVKLVDFDVAHISGSSDTQYRRDGHVLGYTRGYAAPSVFKGDLPGEKEEIYSAGRTCFFWLNGWDYFGREEYGEEIPEYAIDETLGYGLEPDRLEEKYRGERYAGLIRILRKMCCHPDSGEQYDNTAQIIQDMKAFLLSFYGSYHGMKTALQWERLPLLGEEIDGREEKAPMVLYSIGGKSWTGHPLQENTMRDIFIGGKCLMMIYNLQNEIYYIPAIDTELVLKNREKADFGIRDKDTFAYHDIEIQFMIRGMREA